MTKTDSLLTAEARIALPSPGAIFQQLCAHFAAHGSVTVTGERATIAVLHCCADLAIDGQSLAIRVTSASRSGLSVGKMALAEHLFSLPAHRCRPFPGRETAPTSAIFPIFARCGSLTRIQSPP